jgi:hypothetical protein
LIFIFYIVVLPKLPAVASRRQITYRNQLASCGSKLAKMVSGNAKPRPTCSAAQKMLTIGYSLLVGVCMLGVVGLIYKF